MAICQTCRSIFNQQNACGHCKLVHYCSRRCQKKDWKRHKSSCQRGEKRIKNEFLSRMEVICNAMRCQPSKRLNWHQYLKQLQRKLRRANFGRSNLDTGSLLNLDSWMRHNQPAPDHLYDSEYISLMNWMQFLVTKYHSAAMEYTRERIPIASRAICHAQSVIFPNLTRAALVRECENDAYQGIFFFSANRTYGWGNAWAQTCFMNPDIGITKTLAIDDLPTIETELYGIALRMDSFDISDKLVS